MRERGDRRSTREGWLEAGLKALAEEGVAGLTVDAMCRRMEKTKGSFYHHFSGRDDFVARLLEFWERTFTERIIEDLEPLPDPRGKLRALAIRTVREIDLKLERTLRMWSEREPAARAAMERVDRTREGYLREQFEAATGDPRRALIAARAHLALLVGTQMLYQDLSRRELQDLSLFIDFLDLATLSLPSDPTAVREEE